MATVRLGGGAIASSRRGSGSPEKAPPWLRFSARCPCVYTPGRSTFVWNGSGPVSPGLNAVAMMPIDSYQDARRESYVADTDRTSPCLTPTPQSGGVASIAPSHDTAPAGSKYLAWERNSRTVFPPRVSDRSVHSPPGC